MFSTAACVRRRLFCRALAHWQPVAQAQAAADVCSVPCQTAQAPDAAILQHARADAPHLGFGRLFSGAGLGAGDGEKSSEREPGTRAAGTSKRIPRGAPADARPRFCQDSNEARHRSVLINNQLMKAGSLQEVLELTASNLHLFDKINIATAVTRMGKMQAAPGVLSRAIQHPAFASLKAAITRRVSGLEARSVANILHGFASMDHHPGGTLLEACAAQAVERIWEANPQAVAMTLWSFATLQHDPGNALLAACAARAVERIQEATPQNLANTVWSFATLQHNPGAALLQESEAAAVRSAAAFEPQSLANFLWAYATLGECVGASCVAALATRALTLLPHFSAQGLSNTAWALASMDILEPVLIRGIADQVATRLTRHGASAFTADGLGMICWAYSELKLADRSELVRAAAGALAAKGDAANPHALASAVRAMARLGCYDGDVMGRLALEACKQMQSFTRGQSLSNLVWAYGCLRHEHAQLLAAAEARALTIMPDLNAQDLSNLMHAYATLGVMPKRLAPACAHELKRRLPCSGFTKQDLSNLLWSLCIFESCDKELWQRIMAAVGAQAGLPAGLANEALGQVFQAYELQCLDKPAERAVLAAAAPPGLLDAARAVWAKQALQVTSSGFHRDVSRLLRQRGIAHQREARTSDGLFSVDLALPGERIALEADGPSHFAANTLAPGGAMLARNRLLVARGWAVISVPYYVWAELNDDARGAWLMQAIRRAREAQAAAAAQPPGAPRPVPSFAELAAMHAPRRMFEDAVRAAQAAGIVGLRDGG